MKAVALKLVVAMLVCLPAAISHAQQTVGVLPYTVSCPASGTSNTGVLFYAWWANITPSPSTQIALVRFNPSTFYYTVLDIVSAGFTTPRQPAVISTTSNTEYVLEVFANVPSSWSVGTSIYGGSLPGGITNYGGANLTCN